MFHRLTAPDRWRCWVAEAQGTVVGHVWLQLVEKIPNPVKENEQHAYITNLYVEESARGGVGTALIEAALEWCAGRAVDDVILWPTDHSRTLYERHGFSVSPAIMARRLGERERPAS
ncbi:MAG: GNAT family N-acetyltransferase [Gemmatimonadetes bacterium]|nr:GNAT family N-acetyltransferase [Gemmatimonadota bacterium]